METNMQVDGFPVGHTDTYAYFLSVSNLACQKIIIHTNSRVGFVNFPWKLMRSWRVHFAILQMTLIDLKNK